MKLLLVRHAIAGDRDAWADTGQPDALRPLTGRGRRRLRAALRGLRLLVPRLERLLTSPLTRAAETAEILGDAYDVMPEPLEALSPGQGAAGVVEALQLAAGEAEVVALVGHEPDLGELASWLLAEQTDSFLALKKGGACLLELGGARGGATLLWLLTPGQLRRLED